MRNQRKPIDSLLSAVGGNCFQTKRRVFVDGLDVLRKNGMRLDGKCARVVSLSMTLPSGETVSFVGLAGNGPNDPRVSFPPCSAIRASDTYHHRALYDPARFINATIDEIGNVDLQDGAFLHSCEVVPIRLPSEWSAEKHRIVNLAISFMKAEDRCFLEIDWQSYSARQNYPYTEQVRYVPPREPEAGKLRQPAFINYAAVRNLQFDKHKFGAFVEYCNAHTRIRKQRLSRQTIAKILQDAGIRLPRSGRQAHQLTASAASIEPSSN